MHDLRTRFFATVLSHRSVLPESKLLGAFNRLCEGYEQAEHKYHNLDHVQSCLRTFDSIESSMFTDARSVELALWFHDVVYDPRRNDNEERSAQFAMRELDALGEMPGPRNRIMAMIRATRHDTNDLTPDEKIVCDIDLSVLASSSSAYASYVRGVRSEYSFVSDTEFARGRSAFLSKMLKRTHIFHSAYFRSLLEDVARKNMVEELYTYSVRA